jgi:Tfp pilus assembly protein PilF
MKTKHLITIVALVALIATVIGMSLDARKESNLKKSKAHYQQALAHQRQGDRDAATAEFTKAIEKNPGFALAYYRRGALITRIKPDQAISDLTRAIALDPGLSHAYVIRAGTYHRVQEYDKGWDDVHKAESLGIHPDFKSHWKNFVPTLRKDSGREK